MRRLRKKAPEYLGRGYKEADFPETDALREMFDYTVSFSPVPTVDDWRIEGMPEDKAAALKASIESDVEAMYINATMAVQERAMAVVGRLIDQIEKYDDQPRGRLSTPFIDTVKEVADLTTKMNVTGNQALQVAGEEMKRRLATINAKSLREDSDERASLKDAMKEIEEMLS